MRSCLRTVRVQLPGGTQELQNHGLSASNVCKGLLHTWSSPAQRREADSAHTECDVRATLHACVFLPSRYRSRKQSILRTLSNTMDSARTLGRFQLLSCIDGIQASAFVSSAFFFFPFSFLFFFRFSSFVLQISFSSFQKSKAPIRTHKAFFTP